MDIDQIDKGWRCLYDIGRCRGLRHAIFFLCLLIAALALLGWRAVHHVSNRVDKVDSAILEIRKDTAANRDLLEKIWKKLP